MAYATAAQFKVYGLPAVVLSEAPQGAIADATVDEFLAAASAQADAFLRRRYGVPLASGSIPEDITQAVCEIAAYKILRALIGFNPDSSEDKQVKAGHDEGLATLKEYAQGIRQLDQSTDATTTVDEGAPVIETDGAPTLRGFGSSSTRLGSSASDDDCW